MELAGVKVPPELHTAPQRPLEEYVRSRILHFAPAFASRIAADAPPHTVQQAAVDALQELPGPDYSGAIPETRDLMLVFRHDCLNLGCLDPQCVLCEHNPQRRCSVNFANKYLVNDVLRAKCDASIRVELMDRATGQPVREDIPGLTALEMFVVDGNQYDQRCLEAGDAPDEDPALADACALLLNNKATPLIISGTGAAHNTDSRVVVPLSKGVAHLPDLQITDSSEALLSGRKPPFRLIVRAATGGGNNPGPTPPVRIRNAVSEGYVVATRRTRTAGKVEIPNVDDHISKLEHMGKETVKKLQDIRGSARAAGLDVSVPDNAINKVGEFRKLALLAEADGHLRQKLQQVLKLSKEKWEEARDHAMRAVVADNRMRIWYADTGTMEVGLLFTCRLGKVDLDKPVGLLTKKAQEGAQTMMEATLMAQQTPAQREQVRALQPQAESAWWQAGHPGYAIHPIDSDQFLSTGALDVLSVSTTDTLLPLPGSPLSPQLGQNQGLAGFNPALASAFMGSLPNDVLMRAMSPFMSAGSPFLSGMVGMLPGGMAQQGGAGNGQLGGGGEDDAVMAAAGGSGPNAGGGAAAAQPGTTSSPFANMAPPPSRANSQSINPGVGGSGRVTSMAMMSGGPGKTTSMDGMPSFNLGNLQAMFGGDLGKFPMAMQGFPSLPAPSLLGSGDLEHLLNGQLGDAAAGRLPSLNIGRVNSLELPEAPALNTALKPAQVEAAGGRTAVLQRRNSGLESMQSIEAALASVKTEAAQNEVQAAMDAAAKEHSKQKLVGCKRK